MFTDIAGYSSIMSEDEQRAFDLIGKNRQIQRPLIEQYQGKLLKEIGDGVLASFSTVSDAVYCAGAIQKACLAEPDLNLRIGIHLGEVVFEGEDAFGDGVNIASRLEPLAPIGGIVVSDSVNRDLINKQGIESVFMAEKTLKNIKEPIKIFEVKVHQIPSVEPESEIHQPEDAMKSPKVKWWVPVIFSIGIILIGALLIFKNSSGESIEKLESGIALKKSIAVLPFSDFSPEKNQDWFSDGLTEELLNCLARLPELQVTARTSSFAFKGKDLPVQLIADSLGVNYLLEGSVRKSGNKLRVTAQLINPKQDYHLWAETYDREFDDVFIIQEDIANNIAASLDVYLDDLKREQMFAFGTRNPGAYQYYLQGNVLFDKAHSPDGEIHDLAEANTYYDQAIEQDPDFAAPWYRHQDVYSHLLTLASDEHWPDTLTKEVAINQVHNDVNLARSKAQGRAEALFYEMEYAMVTSDWSKVPELFYELETNPQYLAPISHFGGGWSPSLFIALERSDLGLKLAHHELINDPLSNRVKRSIAEYLTAQNLYDSATFWNGQYLKATGQDLGFLGLFLEPERAQEVIENQSSEPNNLIHFAKAIQGGYEIPNDFEENLNSPGAKLIGCYAYSFTGNQSKADSIAASLDSRFMGSFTISDRIINFGGKIRFNLSATPNFAARLKEGGITDLEAYQERHWANIDNR